MTPNIKSMRDCFAFYLSRLDFDKTEKQYPSILDHHSMSGYDELWTGFVKLNLTEVTISTRAAESAFATVHRLADPQATNMKDDTILRRTQNCINIRGRQAHLVQTAPKRVSGFWG